MRYNNVNKDIIRRAAWFVNGFDEKKRRIGALYQKKEEHMKFLQKKYHRAEPMMGAWVDEKEKFAFAKGWKERREGRA